MCGKIRKKCFSNTKSYRCKVNFGAGKISIEGEATIAEIEAAGAFENLKVQSEHDTEPRIETKEPFVKRNWNLLVSLFLIILALGSQVVNGEDALLTEGLFILAIIIGGFSLFKEGFSDLLN